MAWFMVASTLFLLQAACVDVSSAHCPYSRTEFLLPGLPGSSPTFEVSCGSLGAAISWDAGGLSDYVGEINVHYSCITPASALAQASDFTTLISVPFSESPSLDPRSAHLPAQDGQECAFFGCYEEYFGNVFFTFPTLTCSWPVPTAMSTVVSAPGMSHDYHMTTTASAALSPSITPSLSHDYHMTSMLFKSPSSSTLTYYTTVSHDSHVTSELLPSTTAALHNSHVTVSSPDGHVTSTERMLPVDTTTGNSAVDNTSEPAALQPTDPVLIFWVIPAVSVVMATIVTALAVASCIIYQRRKRKLISKRLRMAGKFIYEEDVGYDSWDLVSVGSPHPHSDLSGSVTSIHTVIHKLYYYNNEESNDSEPISPLKNEDNVDLKTCSNVHQSMSSECRELSSKEKCEAYLTTLTKVDVEDVNHGDSGLGCCVSSCESLVEYSSRTHNIDSGLTGDVLHQCVESGKLLYFPIRPIQHSSSDSLLNKTSNATSQTSCTSSKENEYSTRDSSRNKLSHSQLHSLKTTNQLLQPKLTPNTSNTLKNTTCQETNSALKTSNTLKSTIALLPHLNLCLDGMSETGYVREVGVARSQSATELSSALEREATVDIWRAESRCSQDSFVAVQYCQ